MSAIASSRCAAVRRVPDFGGRRRVGSTSAPSDRGKNSYHAPYRARWRCTISGNSAVVVSRSRSGYAVRAAVTAALVPAASRSSGTRASSASCPAASFSALRAARACLASSGGSVLGAATLCAARSSSSAPSASISSTSWPIGTLMPASCRHLATGSPQASTRNCQLPARSGVTSAPYRSLPGASSRMGSRADWAPPGSVSTTAAPSISWPSRNTVAVTWKVSPATALAGTLSPGRTGCTSRIGIRPITDESYPSARPASMTGAGRREPAL